MQLPFLFVSLCLSAFASGDQTTMTGGAASSILEREIDVPRTARGRLSPEHLNVLGVTIGSDTLDQAEARLGRGSAFRIGGDASSVRALCYRHEVGDVEAALVFESSAMGSWTDVTSVTVARVAALGAHAGACEARLQTGRGVTTKGQLRLGMSRSEARRLFKAQPVVEAKDGLGYFFSSESPRPGKSFWSGAWIGLAGDRVEWFRVWGFSE